MSEPCAPYCTQHDSDDGCGACALAMRGPCDPCVNCGRDLGGHLIGERQNCQREHLAGMQPLTWAVPGGYGDLPIGD